MSTFDFIPGIRSATPDVPAADALIFPEGLDLRFEGFDVEAFKVLEALRVRPYIEEYRKQKKRIRTRIQEPFKRYRDDLVVNWVLPNRLALETEKNVFSRLLKNDFGAGGCHHHFWMSFYRPGRRRLRDVQLAHSLWPEALYIVVYVGNPVPDLFRRIHGRIMSSPAIFLATVNPLLRNEATNLRISYGSTRPPRIVEHPLTKLPEDFVHAKEIAVRRAIPREEVIELRSRVIGSVLESIRALWPVYRFCVVASLEDA